MNKLIRYIEEIKDPLKMYESLIKEIIHEISSGKITLKIPKHEGTLIKYKRGHFHTQPELFLQISGSTYFEFPLEKFTLESGEICIIPKYTHHAETVKAEKNPFFNVVCALDMECNIGIHLAEESKSRKGLPVATKHEKVSSDKIKNAALYLEDIIEVFREKTSFCKLIISGLIINYLHNILKAIKSYEPVKTILNDKIVRCMRLISTNISDSEMNVCSLAEYLGCSSDYLSHIFHVETGVKMNTYIRKKRMIKAKELLQYSSLQIRQVAWACGYVDPGYFIKLFKKSEGKTPKEFKNQFV